MFGRLVEFLRPEV